MKKVTVFETSKKQMMVTADHIEWFKYGCRRNVSANDAVIREPDDTPTDEYTVEKMCSPVVTYVIDGKKFYYAMDQELIDLVAAQVDAAVLPIQNKLTTERMQRVNAERFLSIHQSANKEKADRIDSYLHSSLFKRIMCAIKKTI